MKVSTCSCCNKVLADCETIWAAGPLFCSEECGINWAKDQYEDWEYTDDASRTTLATAYFHDVAEEIEVEAIGVRKEIEVAYSPEADITTIFRCTYENDEQLYIDVVGFYFGSPDDEATETYTNSTRATMFRCEDIDN